MCLQGQKHEYWCIKSKFDCDQLQSQMNQHKAELIELHKQQRQIEQQLASSTGVITKQHCPECKTSLSVVNNTIMLFDEQILKQQLATIEHQSNLLNDKMTQIQSLLYQQNILNDAFNQLNHVIAMHSDYLEENVDDLDQDIERNAQELKDMKAKQNEYLSLQTQYQSLIDGTKQDDVSTKYIKQEVHKLQSCIKIPIIQSSSELLAAVNEAQNDCKNIKKHVTDLEYEHKLQAEYKEQLLQMELKHTSIQNKIQSCTNQQQQVSTLSNELQAKQQEVNERKQKAERFNQKKQLVDEWKQQYALYKEYQRLSKMLKQAQEQEMVCQRALQCSLKMNSMIKSGCI
jgi:DNA repair exonuclease SbcCD ATPase subunit